MSSLIKVAPTSEFEDGRRIIVSHESGPIGVVRSGERYVAMADRCPHLAGPLSAGTITKTTVSDAPHEIELGYENGVVTCPWHHWEFDLTDGRCLTDKRLKATFYEVVIQDDWVHIRL
ncbi:Rieske (2Fe-2S) protein [Saccharopolyspora mangrovi]|uniref:Rieske (2Fe-2S) protein n=1 Tax=Saccharopolyspora mangrovi TaxID=3082379 RepID=A0ABU6AG12_9PSEU|nr:Rieske (2Fe-2S) protein [Saccharopolyspora sp. S2-29]MEB3370508.1 Rieske (2Fe-2S) protein [Saccharopolyspora sp. S2-29]